MDKLNRTMDYEIGQLKRHVVRRRRAQVTVWVADAQSENESEACSTGPGRHARGDGPRIRPAAGFSHPPI
jgi:hypothetical protein